MDSPSNLSEHHTVSRGSTRSRTPDFEDMASSRKRFRFSAPPSTAGRSDRRLSEPLISPFHTPSSADEEGVCPPDPPSTPAVMISPEEDEMPEHDDDDIMARFQLEDNRSPEKAVELFANKAKSGRINAADVACLSEWLGWISISADATTKRDLDRIVSHQQWWQLLATTLQTLVYTDRFSQDLWGKDTAGYAAFIVGVLTLCRLLLRAEDHSRTAHHGRRDSYDHGTVEPYEFAYIAVLSAGVGLLHASQRSPPTTRPALEAAAGELVSDVITVDILVAAIKDMLLAPQATKEALLGLRIYLAFLLELIRRLPFEAANEDTTTHLGQAIVHVVSFASERLPDVLRSQFHNVENLHARTDVVSFLGRLYSALCGRYSTAVLRALGFRTSDLLDGLLKSASGDMASTRSLHISNLLDGIEKDHPEIIGDVWQYALCLRLFDTDEPQTEHLAVQMLQRLAVQHLKIEASTISLEDAQMLGAYLHACDIYDRLCRPTYTARALFKCEFVPLFLNSTGHIRKPEIQLLWDTMVTSSSTHKRNDCLYLLMRLVTQAFQPHQIAMVVDVLAASDHQCHDIASLADACLVTLGRQDDMKLLNKVKSQLWTALTTLLPSMDPSDRAGRILRCLERLLSMGLDDAALEETMCKCIFDLAEGSTDIMQLHLMRTLRRGGHGQLESVGLLEQFDQAIVGAFEAHTASLKDGSNELAVARSVDAELQFLDLLLDCIAAKSRSGPAIDHHTLCDLLFGPAAPSDDYRDVNLYRLLMRARDLENLRAIVKSFAMTYLPAVESPHATQHYVALIDFLFDDWTVADKIEITAFCTTMINIILRIEDDNLSDRMLQTLLKRIKPLSHPSKLAFLASLPVTLAEICLDAIDKDCLRAFDVLQEIIHFSRDVQAFQKAQERDIVNDIRFTSQRDTLELIMVFRDWHLPHKVERWTVIEKVTFAQLHSKLESRLETDAFHAYRLGARIDFKASGSKILVELDFASAPILVTLLDAHGMTRQDDLYDNPTAVDETVIKRLPLLEAKLDVDEALSEAAASLLPVIHLRGMQARERLDTALGILQQFPKHNRRKQVYALNVIADYQREHIGAPEQHDRLASCANTVGTYIMQIEGDSNLLHRTLVVFDGLLKAGTAGESQDGGLPTSFLTSPTSLVASLPKHIEAQVALIQDTSLAPAKRKIAEHCLRPLMTTLFEIATLSRDAQNAFQGSTYASEVLPSLLDHNHKEIAIQSARSLEVVCRSFPDIGNGFEVKTLAAKCAVNVLLSCFTGSVVPSAIVRAVAAFMDCDKIRGDLDASVVLSLYDAAMGHFRSLSVQRTTFDALAMQALSQLLTGCIRGINDLKIQLETSVTDVYLCHQLLESRRLDNDDPSLTPTRQSLFTLLQEYMVNGTGVDTVLGHFQRSIAKQDFDEDSYFQGKHQFIRHERQPMGLVNMSQTCYLNSLVQQLFANPRFRACVMEAPVLAEDQAVLAALQTTFAAMKNSTLRHYKPSPLCEALGIDIFMQEDASLFFQMLMSRLETEMPDDDWKKRLQSIFQGVERSQTAGECRHVSETSSAFLVLPLPIKGKQTLRDSLDAFVQGTELSDSEPFKCEKCREEGRQYFVHAERRTRLSDIPEELAINLMRFEFVDGDTRKVNDPFSFPASIDMAPYTISAAVDGSDKPQPDMFELVGVVVHQGRLDFGHYWSYVRHDSDNGRKQWYRAEDTGCHEVSLNYVLSECSGLPVRIKNGLAPRNDNAFLLFYRRVASSPVQAGPIQAFAEECCNEVKEDNERLATQLRFFDDAFQDFLGNTLDLEADALVAGTGKVSELPALDTALLYLRRIARHDVRPDRVQQLCEHISGMMLRVPTTAHRVIRSVTDTKTAVDLALKTVRTNRPAYNWLLIRALEVLSMSDPTSYGIACATKETEGQTDHDCVLVRVVGCLESLVEIAANYIHAWPSLFTLCRWIIALGPVEAYHLAASEILTTCLRFLLVGEDDTLKLRYPDLAERVERQHGPEESWQVVALLMGDLVAYPITMPQDAGDLTNMTMGLARTFTDDQVELLQAFRTTKHYAISCVVSRLLRQCGREGNKAPVYRAPSRFLLNLLQGNTDTGLEELIVSTVKNVTMTTLDISTYKEYIGILEAFCGYSALLPTIKQELLTIPLRRSSDSPIVAELAIDLVERTLDRLAPCEAMLSELHEWILQQLFCETETIRSLMLSFLQETLLREYGRESLLSQLGSSTSLVKFMDHIMPCVRAAINTGRKNDRYVLTAFLHVYDTLTTRYIACIGFKSQQELETLLLDQGVEPSRLPMEALNVNRLRVFAVLQHEVHTWASNSGVDLRAEYEESEEEIEWDDSDEEECMED